MPPSAKAQYVPKPGKTEKELVEEHRGKDDGKFQDPEFRAEGRSLFTEGEVPEGHIPEKMIEWLRPSEFVPRLTDGKSPQLFVDGAEAGDIVQGDLGDCWFLSALSTVASRTDLLRNLFASTEYASQGIYTIRFFKNGRWKYVNIDDRIPCGPTGQPLYARAKEPHEIWPMLIEKAYAKLNGRCYANLKTGTMGFALKDLTGGEPLTINLNEPQMRDECENGFLWQKLKLWVKQGSLLGCSYSVRKGEPREVEYDGGIIRGHAYAIVDVREFKHLRFMRIRNPWGKREWTGAWADFGPEWTNLQRDYPDAPDWMANYRCENDGTFWMLFDDFTRYFNMIYVCIHFPHSWAEELVVGRWDAASNSGGCPDKKNEWWNNPCYRIIVSTRTQIFISMSQRDARCYGNKDTEKQHATSWNKYQNAIGFVVTTETAVAKCQRRHGHNSDSNLRQADMIAKGFPFRKDRDVALTSFPLVLEPSGGPYVVIPMCFEEKVDGKYYLSVKSNKPVRVEMTVISADALPTDGEEGDEDEEEDEDLDENLAHAAEPDEVFPEEDRVLRMSQGDLIALCIKKTECDPWVKKDADGIKLRFEDAEFRTDEGSLFVEPKAPGNAVQIGTLGGSDVAWLRPDRIDFNLKDTRGQLLKPRLFKDDKKVNRGIAQGGLTDAWLLGALGMVATRPEMLRSLFIDYSASCDEFGIYTLRFYKNGAWVQVTVDDRLPCTPAGTMLFARGADPTELWVPIIEKAYAKLHSSYELLGQGSVQYALKDLTGGAPQVLSFAEADVESRIKNGMLWKEMTLLLKSGSLLGASIRHNKGRSDVNLGIEGKLCYSVVDVRDIDLAALGQKMYEGETILRLVKISNPWGKGLWSGPWSPNSDLWATYDRVALEVGHDAAVEDSFWMYYGDFFQVFNTLYINRIFKDPWQSTSVSGCWLRADDTLAVPRRDSAKGAPSSSNPAAWLSNPQFFIYAREKTSCVIILSQKDTRIKEEGNTSKNWKPNEYSNAIGFAVAKASVVRERGMRMRKSDFVALSGFVKDREVSTPFTLQLNPQDSPYVVVPMTLEPGCEGDYVLNVWHKKPIFLRGGELLSGPSASDHDHEEEQEDSWGDWDVADKGKDDDDVVGEVAVGSGGARAAAGGGGGGGSAGGASEGASGGGGAAGRGLSGGRGGAGEGGGGGVTSSSATDGPPGSGGGGASGGGATGGIGGGQGDVYSALVTLARALGPTMSAEQKQELASALGLDN